MSVLELRYAVAIDIATGVTYPTIRVIKNDTLNYIDFTVTNNGVVVDLSNKTMSITIKRPDGSVTVYGVDSKTGNTAIWKIPLTSMDILGKVEVEIEIFEGIERMSSRIFRYTVVDDLLPDDNTDVSEGTATYPILNDVIQAFENFDPQQVHTHSNKAVLDKFGEDVGGNPLYNGASIGSGGSGSGDMLKSTYDTTNNGIVDRAEVADSVTWANVSGKPTIPTNLSSLADDSTHRVVTDTEKSTWNSKASTSTATTSTDGLMSSTDKTKLDGVASDADKVESSLTNGNVKINGTETTVYTHPSNHSPSVITQDSSNRFVTDAEKTAWNAKSSFSGSYTDLTNKPTIPDITSLTNAVSTILTVSASSNTYTLDLSTALNFIIETTDTNAKTIAFSNVPATANTIVTISIILKFTNSATFTYPTGTVWKDGAIPIFTAGKKYMLMFTTYDNGTSYLGSYVGMW